MSRRVRSRAPAILACARARPRALERAVTAEADRLLAQPVRGLAAFPRPRGSRRRARGELRAHPRLPRRWRPGTNQVLELGRRPRRRRRAFSVERMRRTCRGRTGCRALSSSPSPRGAVAAPAPPPCLRVGRGAAAGLEGAPGRLTEGVRDAAPPGRRRVPRLRAVARGLLHRRGEGRCACTSSAFMSSAQLEHAGPDLVRAEQAQRAAPAICSSSFAPRQLAATYAHRAGKLAAPTFLAAERSKGRDVALDDDGPSPGVRARACAAGERFGAATRPGPRLEAARAPSDSRRTARRVAGELALDVLHVAVRCLRAAVRAAATRVLCSAAAVQTSTGCAPRGLVVRGGPIRY